MQLVGVISAFLAGGAVAWLLAIKAEHWKHKIPSEHAVWPPEPTTPPVGKAGDPICAGCNQYSSLHRLANFADGPCHGEAFLVCPTAVFER